MKTELQKMFALHDFDFNLESLINYIPFPCGETSVATAPSYIVCSD